MSKAAGLPVNRGLPFAQSSVDKFMEQMQGTPRTAKQAVADTPVGASSRAVAAAAPPYTPSAVANMSLSTSMLSMSMSAELTTQMVCMPLPFLLPLPPHVSSDIL